MSAKLMPAAGNWDIRPCVGLGGAADHNCIPVRRWFRSRWVCVRCGHTFKVDTR